MSLRAAGVARGRAVTISLDGAPLPAHEGEMLAAALWAEGIVALRVSNVSGEPRGPLCFMGICQECLVRVDGVMRQACLVGVHEGMTVERCRIPERTGP